MNDKILDRIRKLLAMAGDTASPNEAAIAAKRARHLMDQYQVAEMDLRTTNEADFGTADQLYMGSWHGMLGIAMGRLNDVNVRQVNENGFALLRFEGYLVDAVTAKELWLYLAAQCEQQAKKVRGRKDDYHRGFASGVQQQVRDILKDREQIKTANGTSLVLCKRNQVTQRYGEQQTRRVSGRKSANFTRGQEAGLKAGLNRQVRSNKPNGYLS